MVGKLASVYYTPSLKELGTSTGPITFPAKHKEIFFKLFTCPMSIALIIFLKNNQQQYFSTSAPCNIISAFAT